MINFKIGQPVYRPKFDLLGNLSIFKEYIVEVNKETYKVNNSSLPIYKGGTHRHFESKQQVVEFLNKQVKEMKA